MKKFFLLFVILIAGFSAFAQTRAKRDTVIVYSFPKKALKENTDIFVRFSTDPSSDSYSVIAYKGETREKFIARLKKEGQEEKKKK